ncbi:MAG: radical SAM protein [Nitrospirota bacterium]
MLRLVLEEGGPGFCQFAITDACNARCAFCSFARDALSVGERSYAAPEAAAAAIDILSRRGIRYLVITGGEPLLHPHLEGIVGHAAVRGMRVLLVTNGALLTEQRIQALAGAGLSGFIISIDAMDEEAHETNRGLPGVCRKIGEANGLIKRWRMSSTASVTMSRLVDYDAVPAFLRSLGFSSVTFSYPLEHLASSFRGYAPSELVSYRDDELIEAFEAVKRLKKRFAVVNPTPSLEEMQRFVRKEPQRYPCLAGYKYFYLDWNLDLWRCHNGGNPLCSVFDFDGSQCVRDGCTRCMIDCYRDSSVMHQVGIALHDAYLSLRAFRPGAAAQALLNRSTFGSLRAVIEEFTWIRRL